LGVQKTAFQYCIDPGLSLAELLQAFLRRWGVEGTRPDQHSETRAKL
jgi:hypothetical protein